MEDAYCRGTLQLSNIYSIGYLVVVSALMLKVGFLNKGLFVGLTMCLERKDSDCLRAGATPSKAGSLANIEAQGNRHLMHLERELGPFFCNNTDLIRAKQGFSIGHGG